MTFIGVIPARGGSKGIPRKNLALCAGQSLLAHASVSALQSNVLQRVILSTDAEEIAVAGRALGLEVPFLRPSALAADDTLMVEVLRHLLDWLTETGQRVDGLVLLQPTSPLRRAAQVAEATAQFEATGAATLVSVTRVPHQFTPGSVMELKQGCLTPWQSSQPNVLRRQDKPDLYARNGPAILIVRPDLVRAGQLYGEPTVGYLMSAHDSVDVDGPEDLRLAELLLRDRQERGEA